MNPVFLELAEVLTIHEDQISRHGGSPGLRDLGLLESALAMPSAGLGGQYFHSDIHEMAAAYLYHLVKNHPFIDGNKRVGAAAAIVFLELNGIALQCSNRQLVELVLGVAEGLCQKDVVTSFLRLHSEKPKARSRKAPARR